MTPATYTYPSQVRGDTIRSRTFTIEIDSVAADILSAEMNIRNSDDSLIKNVALTVDANIITQPELSQAVTEVFPIGTLYYDIEVTLNGGLVRTYISGTIPITKDYTYE